MKTGVECEFFLITPDGNAISDDCDRQQKPCYDQSALMRRYDVIAEICDAMLALGWGPYQNDHEDANGQFEMNWGYAPALATADRHVLLQIHGQVDRGEARPARDLHAEAVPGPDRQSGCHAHVSLWQRRDATCSPTTDGELGLSALGQALPRRHDGACRRRCARDHQPDGQLLQAHQRAAHHLGRDLVAEHRDLRPATTART